MRPISDDWVRQVLESSGWYPSRRVRLDDLTPRMRAAGFDTFRAAEEILAEFSGLEISAPRREGAVVGPTPFDFRPLDSAADADDLSLWTRIAETRLCPVGGALGWLALLCSEAGTVLAGETDRLYLLGDDLTGAFDVLVAGYRPPILLENPRPHGK